MDILVLGFDRLYVEYNRDYGGAFAACKGITLGTLTRSDILDMAMAFRVSPKTLFTSCVVASLIPEK